MDDTVVAEVVLILRERGAHTPPGALYAEIVEGGGPALIAEARRRISEPDTCPVDPRPAAVRYRDLCPRCSRTGHGADDCPDREPPPTPPSVGPAPRAAAEPCHAGEHCQRPLSPIDPATGYHARCRAAAGVRASMAARVSVPAAGASLAAEQVAEARALREAAELAGSEAVAS